MPARFNEKPWALLVGAIAVTAFAWGIYAWKVSDTGPQLPPAPVSASIEGSENSRHGRSDEHSTAHRSGGLVTDDGIVSSEDSDVAQFEEHPPIPDDDIGSLVHANSAPNMDKPIEVNWTDAASRPPPLRSAVEEFEEAQSAKQRGDLVGARNYFSRAISRNLPAADAETARTELAKISTALTFSRTVEPKDTLSRLCTIGGGDSLYAMANRYHLTPELIAEINKLADPSKVILGAKMKVLTGPFRVIIHKKSYRLDVYLGDIYIRSFKVGLGTGDSTPLGRWKVVNKLSNPDWSDPKTGQYYLANDPANPIGERWIGLQCESGDCMGRTGFGIHGTIDPGSIGADMSMGCVRLASEDIASLYDLLVPKYSTVEIVP